MSYAQKNMKKKSSNKKGGSDYTPSKPGTFKNAFREARADKEKTFTWNGNTYTTELATDKNKKEDSKTKSKKTSSVKRIKNDPISNIINAKNPKKQKQTSQGTQLANMAQQTMGAEDNIRRQIEAAKKKKPKTKNFSSKSLITANYTPKKKKPKTKNFSSKSLITANYTPKKKKVDNKKIPDIQPFKKGGKISSGSIFVAKQYGGKII
jgi:hypothetical protein|tara:strand:- start:795 stop:1418 length:624 start_codon:yes stop_codon:yes gene_type:complete